MNPTITFILSSNDPALLEGLETMLPSKGRPLFDEDVESKWFDLYKSIELLEPPVTLKRVDQRIFLAWHETNHAVVTLKNTFKKSGAVVEFIHAIEGDPSEADPGSGEDDFNGQYFINADGELKSLTRDNVKKHITCYSKAWIEDFEENVAQITERLMR